MAYSPKRGAYVGQTFSTQYQYRKQRDIDLGYSGAQRNKGQAPIPTNKQTDRWLDRAVERGYADSIEEARNNEGLKELYHAAEREGWKEDYGSHFDKWLRELGYHDEDLGDTFDDESPKGKKK